MNTELADKRCGPCEGGVEPLQPEQVAELMRGLHGDWMLSDDGLEIARTAGITEGYSDGLGLHYSGTESFIFVPDADPTTTTNPLVFPEVDDFRLGGNFHGQPVAMALDLLGIAMSEVGGLSERHINRLMNPSLNLGLPAFLVKEGGLNSGFMMVQVTAAALASENKALAHPASVDSLPTSANQEDHVSMAPWAGQKLQNICDNLEHILAIELLAAARAIEAQAPLKATAEIEDIR